MSERPDEKRWLWVTLVLSSTSIVAVVYAFWELVENQYFRDLDYVSLHYLYVSRGIASSLLLAIWASWYVLQHRRHAEEELRRSRERYRGLLELSPAAVALYDSELNVVEWNKAAERLYGVARSEVVGKALPSLPDQRFAELADLMAQVERGEPVLDHETLRCDRHGETFEVQLSLLPFVEGYKRFFLEVTSDIRDKVRLRQRLLELEKLTTMGRMAAGTAHHLNTPLASMLLRLQMMRDVCDPQKQASVAELQQPETERTCIDTMHDHLDHMNASLAFCQSFVRRLLDFARPPMSIRQPENMRSVIEAVIGFVSPSILAKRVKLEKHIEGLDGARVLGDRNQLETMLLILLSNSLDALSDGGTLKIAGAATNDSVKVSVIDNGAGIREQDLAHVFEPFFTTKPIGKGTGLGLPIAQNIVSEHGGEISIASTVGAGTEVRLQLPACTGVRAEVLA